MITEQNINVILDPARRGVHVQVVGKVQQKSWRTCTL